MIVCRHGCNTCITSICCCGVGFVNLRMICKGNINKENNQQYFYESRKLRGNKFKRNITERKSIVLTCSRMKPLPE